MIYDLKELAKDVNAARDMGHIPSDVDKLKMRSLLAIAERLEALVEAQKPRLQGEPDRNENETPQPVATLCEVVERLLTAADEQYCGSVLEPLLENLRHALTAERKRAVLVENLIDAVRRFYQENDGRYDLLRVRLSELDAHDKEVGNG